MWVPHTRSQQPCEPGARSGPGLTSISEPAFPKPRVPLSPLWGLLHSAVRVFLGQIQGRKCPRESPRSSQAWEQPSQDAHPTPTHCKAVPHLPAPERDGPEGSAALHTPPHFWDPGPLSIVRTVLLSKGTCNIIATESHAHPDQSDQRRDLLPLRPSHGPSAHRTRTGGCRVWTRGRTDATHRAGSDPGRQNHEEALKLSLTLLTPGSSCA